MLTSLSFLLKVFLTCARLTLPSLRGEPGSTRSDVEVSLTVDVGLWTEGVGVERGVLPPETSLQFRLRVEPGPALKEIRDTEKTKPRSGQRSIRKCLSLAVSSLREDSNATIRNLSDMQW